MHPLAPIQVHHRSRRFMKSGTQQEHSSINADPKARETRTHESGEQPQARPEFIIIGLFGLRIAREFLTHRDAHPERNTDIAWINNFLQPYPSYFALDKIKDCRMDDYAFTYPKIASRFTRQPKYRRLFERMNPDRRIVHRKLTDRE